jgi:glycosyltransferase involved in cell wall biosynthesis
MRLSVVIPCYNEEEVLPYTSNRVLEVLNNLVASELIKDYEIIFVNDASKDNTKNVIEEFIHSIKSHRIKLLNLNSNSGHQAAMLAGIEYATGDAIISLDADLQDPPEYFSNLIGEYNKGNDIVIAIWNNREIESPIKRFFATNFYRIAKLLGVPGEKNAGDFRLISKNVQKSLLQYPERNLFLRGLIPSMKFKTSKIYYKRAPRTAGVTKYPFSKSLNLAIDGITSFSIRPLRIVGILGLLLFVVGILLTIYVLFLKFSNDIPIIGWTSTITAVILLQSFNFIFLSIIGEYIGKVYLEAKQRPRYVIKDKVGF